MIAIVTHALFAATLLKYVICTATHVEVASVSGQDATATSFGKVVDLKNKTRIATAKYFTQLRLAQFPAGWGSNLLPLFFRKIESALFRDGEESFLGIATLYVLR